MGYYWELQKYAGQNTRFRCPNCEKSRQYTRYINARGEYAPYEYGKCNRLEKCGYSLTPGKEVEVKGVSAYSLGSIKAKKFEQEFINWNDYNYDFDDEYDLIQYIIYKTEFTREQVSKVFQMYHVRTEGYKIVLPYVDQKNRLTYVKLMEYKNGRRSKFIYTPFKAKKGRFKQCLFGQHLVDGNTPVCVVESEKTALICKLFYPGMTWVATGGSQFLKLINVLDRASVFADKGKAFIEWKTKINIMQNNTVSKHFSMNNLLEEKKDLPDGSDMADYLLNDY